MISPKSPKKLNNLNYYFSKYINTLEKKGIIVVFHNLHPIPFYIKKKTWNNFLKLPRQKIFLFKKLRKLKLIIKSSLEDKKELQKARKIKTLGL